MPKKTRRPIDRELQSLSSRALRHVAEARARGEHAQADEIERAAKVVEERALTLANRFGPRQRR